MTILCAVGGGATIATATVLIPVEARLGLPVLISTNVVGGLIFFTALTLAAAWGSATASSGIVVVMTTAPIAAAILLGGPTAGVWVALVGTIEPRELRGDVPLQQVLEKHLTLATAAGLGGAVILLVQSPVARISGDPVMADMMAFICGSVVMWLATLGLALPRVSLTSGRSMRQIARDAWSGEAVAHWVLLVVGFLMAEAYLHVAWWAAALFIVPLVAVRASVERDRLGWAAAHDPLTGLLSRRDFDRRLEELLRDSTRERNAAGLLIIDLDRFKEVNDTHGHTAGDAVLQVVAARLTAAVRRTDAVARLGGDEFAVLIRQADDEAALQARAETIIGAVRQPVDIEGVSVAVGASVGGVCVVGGDPSSTEVFASADRAMYKAKMAQTGARIESLRDGVRSQAQPEIRIAPAAAGATRVLRKRPARSLGAFALLVGMLATGVSWINLGPVATVVHYYQVAATWPSSMVWVNDSGLTPTLNLVADDGSGRSPIPREDVPRRIVQMYRLDPVPPMRITGPFTRPSFWAQTDNQEGVSLLIGAAAALLALLILLLVGVPARLRPMEAAMAASAGMIWQRAGTTGRAKVETGVLVLLGTVTCSAVWAAGRLVFVAALPLSGVVSPTDLLLALGAPLAGGGVLLPFPVTFVLVSVGLFCAMAAISVAVRRLQPGRGVGAFVIGLGGAGVAAMIATVVDNLGGCYGPIPGLLQQGTTWFSFSGPTSPAVMDLFGPPARADGLQCFVSSTVNLNDFLGLALVVAIVAWSLLIYRQWRRSLGTTVSAEAQARATSTAGVDLAASRDVDEAIDSLATARGVGGREVRSRSVSPLADAGSVRVGVVAALGGLLGDGTATAALMMSHRSWITHGGTGAAVAGLAVGWAVAIVIAIVAGLIVDVGLSAIVERFQRTERLGVPLFHGAALLVPLAVAAVSLWFLASVNP